MPGISSNWGEKDPLKIEPRKNTVGLYSQHYKKDDLEDC